ncbi:hypothetical protein pipiens_002336 [Culex pipiens pipiens]|uniref:Uncharacterized protein n=1 Tax=Culex pipiens pipiens TaxID=38569 RepID=A0ABD1DGX8_CULPP
MDENEDKSEKSPSDPPKSQQEIALEEDRINELQGAIEDMRLTMEEATHALTLLESKIADHRARNPLEPVPAELVYGFCQNWIKNCHVATETISFQQLDADAEIRSQQDTIREKEELAASDTVLVDFEALVCQKKDNVVNLQQASDTNYELRLLGGKVRQNWSREKIKVAETIQMLREARRDCEKSERALEQWQRKIRRVERDIEELEEENAALKEKVARYRPPGILEIARKFGELEQAKEELFKVVKRKVLED